MRVFLALSFLFLLGCQTNSLNDYPSRELVSHILEDRSSAVKPIVRDGKPFIAYCIVKEGEGPEELGCAFYQLAR